MVIFIVLVIILIVTLVFNQCKRPHNFPPGPQNVPFFGNTLTIKKIARQLGGQHHALQYLSKIYKSNTIGLKLGPSNVIVVFSYPIVRQVLTSELFEGRPDNFFLRLRCLGARRGITCLDGEIWSLHRHFVVRHLRNVGYGKRPMELLVQDEINQLLPQIANLSANDSGRIGKYLAPSVINILWSLVTSKKISRKSSQLNRLLDLLELRSKAFDMSGGSLSQFPWLRFIAPEWCGYNLIRKMNADLKELLMETINEHHRSWQEGKNEDLIDAFISEMKAEKQENSTFTNEQLVVVCLDLFIAGAQTTSNTLDFAFLAMILHPTVQENVHKCLDQFESVKYVDRSRIPYIEAVLLEVQRFYTIVPIAGPRRVLDDTILDGYLIPKDTTVLISLHSVHHDPDYWKDPEKFRPERFLNEDGQLLPQDRIISFGLGRRRCLGDALARMCIFTFFVEILKQYRVELKPGSSKPTGIPLPGITLSPEKYEAIFVKR